MIFRLKTSKKTAEIFEELEKRKQYHPDNIFKNKQQVNKDTENLNTTTQLVEYKENFFVKFKNFIFKF